MKKIIVTVRPVVLLFIVMFQFSNAASAQVATLSNWTSLYHGNSSALQNINYIVPPGSNTNRLLVVAIASERTAAGTLSVSLSYGGQTLTLAAGDIGVSSIQHTALYFLNEAGLDAAGINTTLSVSVSGGTIRMTDVSAAVFDYINQTTPLTDSKNYNSGSTNVTDFSFSPALLINSYNQAVEVIAIHNSGSNQFRTITYAPEWTMVLDQTATYLVGFTGYSLRNSVANRTIPASDISDSSPASLNAPAAVSLTGLSMNFIPPPPPTIQASDITFTKITSTSLTIKWTNGNGTNRLVLIKQGSVVNAVPVDGTTYSANNGWTSGQEIETGNFVVYNGTADSIVVVNLEAATTYHVAVYEFSGPPGLEEYLETVEPARAYATTLPETAVNGDYRSKVTGDWGSPASWQVYNDGVWTDATTTPSNTDGTITVRAGHTITVAESVTADQMFIDAGGQVDVTQNITFTIADNTVPEPDPADCVVNGTLNIAGTLTAAGDLVFNNGSVYIHATNGGTIPAATWDANSNCQITGISDTAPSGLGQIFGNFTWNCTSQIVSLTVPINNNITVLGNCNISSTGSGKLALTDTNTSYAMTISGDFTQTGGTFILNNGLSSTVTNYLYVAGDFQFTGGTITEFSSTGRGAIVFNGNGVMQTYSSGGTFQNTIDFRVEPGAYLQLGSGQVPAYITLSKGTFTLSAGATLGITSPYGITLSSTANPSGGNIRVTGTRTYDSGANYIFNGNVSQYTGDGLPATVNALNFNNNGGSIRFLKAHTITNDFSITSGSRTNLGTFSHSTSFLSLGGESQPGGSYGGTTSGADFEIPEYFDEVTGIINNNPPIGTWLGNTTDWNVASNWFGGIPNGSSTTIITSYAPNQPVITGTTAAVSNILTINSGASLTINGSADITSMENNGNVTINPGGTATFDNVINSGILNLVSDPSGMFSFMTENFSGSGTVNTRLFLTGGLAGDPAEELYRWHYLAVPSQQNKSVLTSINPDNLMWYSEPAAVTDMFEGWQWHDGYDGTTAITDLEVTDGYSFYHDEDTYVTFTGSSLLTSLPQKDLGFSTFGWNFIGNSLTCGINWDDVILNGDVDPSVNFIKDYQEYYYIQGGPGVPAGTTGSIPPLQGFFVQATAAGASIDFSAAKEHNNIAYYKGSKAGPENKSNFSLIRLKVGDGNHTDETAIWFNENSTTGKDRDYDAEKRISGDSRVQIWSGIKGHSFAINGIPFPEKSIDIPLSLRIPAEGKYSITQAGLENLEEGYAFYLKDLEKKSVIKLNSIPTYSFTTTKGIINNRFVLTIENLSANSDEGSPTGKPFNIYHSSGLINIDLLSESWEGKRGSVKVIDLTGRTVIDSRNVEFSRSSLIQLPVDGNKGLLIIKLESSLLRHSGRIVIK